MESATRCPTCDKEVRIPESGVALCLACGTTINLHRAPVWEAADRAAAGDDAGVAYDAGVAEDAGGPAREDAAPVGDAIDLGQGDAAGESVVVPAALTAGDTTLALQAQRAERWAHGEREGGGGGGNGGDANGAEKAPAPVRASLFGSDAQVAVTPEDLKRLVFPGKAGRVELFRDFWRGRHPLWWLLAGAATTAVAGALFLLLTGRVRPFGDWQEEHRAQLVELKGQADRLAAAGKLQQAHDTYVQMDSVIKGRPVRDPELKQVVDAAEIGRRRVYDVLLEERMGSAQARNRVTADAQAGAQALNATPSGSAARPPATPASSSPQPATAPAVAVARPGRQRAPLQPVPPERDFLTDEKIGQSIQRGVDWLLAQFDPRTHTLSGSDNPKYSGMDALAVYALLQCSFATPDPRISIRDERMRARVEAMKHLQVRGQYETYARGIRASCLALLNRREDLVTLRGDAQALADAHHRGAYTYKGQLGPGESWDNSNSQYGLLGVWSAVDAEPGIAVGPEYWRAVEAHWRRTQHADGQWGYGEADAGGARLSMTAAGIASLFVAHDYLDVPPSGPVPSTAPADILPVGRDPFSPALKKGLDWFERENNAVNLEPSTHWGYTLYGVERVGLASGFKYFGKHDWYRVLAQQIVRQQQEDGGWGDGIVDTSFALLFLSRGRHPVVMSKLRFDRGTAPGDGAPADSASADKPPADRANQGADPATASETGTGFWANRPRDVANLARFTGRVLERPLNWQVVNLDREFQDWMDSPILYIASHATPQMSPADYAKLRQFVDAGGLIFTHADAGSAAFNQWAERLPAELSLPYPMADVPDDHLVHTIVFKPSPRPQLRAVSNGSRLLIVHSPLELSQHWQKREDRPFELATTKRPAEVKARVLAPFHFGANLFVYAAGKRDLRNRLDSPYVPPPNGSPVDVIPVARLEYGGNWDPEPGAWQRYANWFHRQTGTRLEPRAVKLAELRPDPSAYPIAHLTGTEGHQFTAEEAAALKKYVEAGGMVFADVCGGGPAFGASLSRLARQAFPAAAPAPVPAGHPMLSAGAPGMEDVSRLRVRLYNLESRGAPGADLHVVAAGSGHFVLTTGDAVSGLLGTNTWGILGYEPKYAQALMKNLIFWTADGQPKPGG